jgi:hypothetical protein
MNKKLQALVYALIILLIIVGLFQMFSLTSGDLTGKPIGVLKQDGIITLTKNGDVYESTFKTTSDNCIKIQATGANPLQGTIDQVDLIELEECLDEGDE